MRQRWLAITLAAMLSWLAGATAPRAASPRGWATPDAALAVMRPVLVPPNHHVDHDLVNVASSLQVYGTVRGDIVVVFGDAHVFGVVTGDAVALFGRIIVRGEDAAIGGDATAVAGRVEKQAQGRILGSTRESLRGAQGPRALLGLLAIVTALALGIALAAPSALGRASLELERRPVTMLLAGVLAHGVALLLALPCIVLIGRGAGLSLLALLVVAVLGLQVMGLSTALHRLGERLAGGATARPRARVPGMLAAGALLVAFAALVPFLGASAALGAATWGSGALLATWTRRARPEAAA